MKQVYLHRPGLEIEVDFSYEDPPIFRYRLCATKVAASSVPSSVCVIMQNPSYACVEHADKSVQVLERVVFEKGYEEFERIERLIIVNQFAFIQTNDFAGTEDKIRERNDISIKTALAESEVVLIAWGSNNAFKERQQTILEMIKRYPSKTKLQTSSHPSRMEYDGFIQPLRT